MSLYGMEYFNLIQEGLKNIVVTNNEGKELSVDEGLDIWAEKAENIKKNPKNLIFFCGNGASASMAEHMSHDWFQNALVNTATCAEVTHLTAISNDIGYEDVYRFRVKRIVTKNDMIVGISSSGNSPNIVAALQSALDNGAFVISVSGKKADNKIRSMGNLNFYVPLKTYGEVESAHSVLLHTALDYYLDKFLGGRH